MFALSFCYVRIRQGQRKEADRRKTKRDREEKRGQRETEGGVESVPSGLVASLPAGFGGRYG